MSIRTDEVKIEGATRFHLDPSLSPGKKRKLRKRLGVGASTDAKESKHLNRTVDVVILRSPSSKTATDALALGVKSLVWSKLLAPTSTVTRRLFDRDDAETPSSPPAKQRGVKRRLLPQPEDSPPLGRAIDVVRARRSTTSIDDRMHLGALFLLRLAKRLEVSNPTKLYD